MQNVAPPSKMADWKNASSVYDFTVKDIAGNDVSLEKYRWVPMESVKKKKISRYLLGSCLGCVPAGAMCC